MNLTANDEKGSELYSSSRGRVSQAGSAHTRSQLVVPEHPRL